MAFTLEQEQSLLALLEEKKITLSELPAATDLIEDDLILMRQGIIDKSVNNGVLKRYFTPLASSLTESGIVKLSNAIDSTDEHTAATSKAVKVSYDLAIAANKNANSRLLATEAAVAADKLTIPRFISGVPFDGTTDIVLSAGNIGAYTKTESDIRYQVKGNYTPAGQAYTKAESDTRYQIKGNYTPAGQAYTKAESEARYVQYMRLGSQVTTDYIAGYNDIPGGCVVTGIDVSGDNSSSASIRYRPIQILINGQWLNIGGL